MLLSAGLSQIVNCMASSTQDSALTNEHAAQGQDPNAAMAVDMAAGMYPSLEQQVAAAASGIGPLMGGAALSPPRSTDVRQPPEDTRAL